jgi:ubiquinone/menaquinone biosynthesis C-methylase UbiE
MTIEPDPWQLAGAAAELYERHLVPAVTLPWAADLVQRVGVKPGDRVLDLACGTGAVARLAAERGARVTGLDVNAGMLAVARTQMPQLEWVEGSALAMPFADGAFDVVLCQLGLQFFPDPAAALQETRRVLANAGRSGASVYAAIERNPAAEALSAALDRHLGEGASRAKRAEHALASVGELRALVEVAFAHARIETVSRTLRFASVDDWVRIQFAATPLAALLAGQDEEERERIVGGVSADVGARLETFVGPDGFAFPQEVHVVLVAP